VTGTDDAAPEVNDPLFVPLAQVAVPVAKVAVRPVEVALPEIKEPLNSRCCPDCSVNVEFDSSMPDTGPLVEIAEARASVAERYVFETRYEMERSPNTAEREIKTLRFLRILQEVKNAFGCFICTKLDHTSARCL
jgi:hypothetical protein